MWYCRVSGMPADIEEEYDDFVGAGGVYTPSVGTPGKNFINTHLNKNAGSSTLSGAHAQAGLAWRSGTQRLAQAITLYMPPSVRVSYKSNYKNDEIGMRAGAVQALTGPNQPSGASVIDAFQQGYTEGGGWSGGVPDFIERVLGGAWQATASTLGESGVVGAALAIKGSADTFAPGISTLAQIALGSIVGSKMEVMFTDVGRRNFSFTFNFIPKSEQEARIVYDIVQTFKEHMLPEYLDDFSLAEEYKAVVGSVGGTGTLEDHAEAREKKNRGDIG